MVSLITRISCTLIGKYKSHGPCDVTSGHIPCITISLYLSCTPNNFYFVHVFFSCFIHAKLLVDLVHISYHASQEGFLHNIRPPLKIIYFRYGFEWLTQNLYLCIHLSFLFLGGGGGGTGGGDFLFFSAFRNY